MLNYGFANSCHSRESGIDNHWCYYDLLRDHQLWLLFNYSASISRSEALPRKAVGEVPPHEQPHVCPVPLCLSILSKLCFGWRSHTIRVRWRSLVTRRTVNSSISRSVALPRKAVGEVPPHEQPHVCPVPLCLSILSKLCFGWRSHTIRVRWRSLVTRRTVNSYVIIYLSC